MPYQQLNEAAFLRDCTRFYSGADMFNPTVTNMTSYGVPHKRALELEGQAKIAANAVRPQQIS